MPPDLTSDNIRSRSFRVSRRGYDRTEVDRFRGDVADEVFRMEGRIKDLEAKVDQLGLNDVGLLGEELEKLGADITAILEQAVVAATEIRKRAIEDADLWQVSADPASGDTDQTAGAPADEDELQQLAEDELAAARTESDRLLGDVESQRLRLLDDMRGIARDAASDEAGADGAVDAGDSSDADVADTSTADADPDASSDGDDDAAPADDDGLPDPYRRTWEDEAGVRIVPSSRVLDTGPIDADDMVAEVEQLRARVPGDAASTADDDPGARAPSEVDVGSGSTGDAAPTDAATGTTAEVTTAATAPPDPGTDEGDEDGPPPPVTLTVVGSGRSRTSQLHPVEEPVHPVEEPDVGPDERDEAGDEPAAEPEATAEPESAGDDPALPRRAIGDLFASLRTAPGDTSVDGTPDGTAQPDGRPGSGGAADDGPRDVNSAPEAPSAATGTASADPIAVVEPSVATAPEVTVDTATDLRDRLLLPIQNRALRGVKREIVELQNVALDGIRHGAGDWEPDTTAYNASLTESLASAIDEAYAAGIVGAAEMTGTGTPPLVGSATVTPGAFVDALVSAARGAYDDQVRDEGGGRQVAASVSRVFRAWRTDEAERRLRSTVYHAYHEGVLTGFAGVGVTAVTTVTTGRRCADCDAVTDLTWDPDGPLPAGVVMPPAHAECVATFVPVATGGTSTG